jgi:cytoskeletal protein CcmA (bactofilin family)
MWTKQSQSDVPGYAPAQAPSSSSQPIPFNSPASNRGTSSPAARNVACLGSSIEVKGKISGEEDLQVVGKVEGPIALAGQRLTVGRSGQIASEVTAREVVVYGKVTGNLRASDRVEIKKDGSVTGDIITSRISIEDGAFFKGRIEIDNSRQHSSRESEQDAEPVGAAN